MEERERIAEGGRGSSADVEWRLSCDRRLPRVNHRHRGCSPVRGDWQARGLQHRNTSLAGSRRLADAGTATPLRTRHADSMAARVPSFHFHPLSCPTLAHPSEQDSSDQ